jgi:hypothetical protein
VDLNKNGLRAHGQQVAAQEALKKAKIEQHMEAKKANFNYMISKNEADIDRIVSQLENQKKANP